MSVLDANGQPAILSCNSKRLNDRSVDVLIGLCKGIIADKSVNQTEEDFLQS